MNGSAKQIKWANDIISSKMEAFDKLERATKNDIGRKAVDYIRNNQNAAFWIDYRDMSPVNMLHELIAGTLRIRGFKFDHVAKIDAQTGVITETWAEIISDGKGGHKVTRTRTL